MDPGMHLVEDDLPEEFVECVRHALLSLYDPSALQSSPLLEMIDEEHGTIARIQRCRRVLLDAIEMFHPKPGVSNTSRAWRIYRILELRYIERNDVSDVIDQIALSKSQYHREHHYALQAVARLLWKGSLPGGKPMTPASARSGLDQPDRELLQHEVASLQQTDGSARVDPVEVLRGVAELLRPLCEKRGVVVRLDAAEDVPAVPGDRVALRQGLLPVLTSAIRAVDHAEIPVTVEFRSRRVEIVIGGIGQCLLGQWESVLAECQAFIQALHGRISLPTSAHPTGDVAIRLSFPAWGGEQSTLLVVDNNVDFTALVTRYLAGQDWEVIGATTVDQALQVATSFQTQAILLDVIIPGQDGWDLLARLKSSPGTRNIPVVACSILDEPEIAMALGAAAYLRKPIDRERLIRTIESVRRPSSNPIYETEPTGIGAADSWRRE